ncbi:MAG: hypothetical protein R3284_04580 [Rubricoccaceae bacterium]|nr:hypothetical protein [Rubricoccaceae bacterium]
MNRKLAYLVVLATSIPISAFATRHFGTGTAPWDFSRFESPVFGEEHDLVFVRIVGDGTLMLHASYPGLIAALPDDTSFEDLRVAPAFDPLYRSTIEYLPGRVWVIKTTEGHYAKVRFHNDGNSLSFDYVYQDDGSRNLKVTLDEVTTWSVIKAFYE